MATNYFRVTAYYAREDLGVIFDTNGMFEKLWQLSSFLLQKGLQITEVSSDEKFLDGNISKAEPDNERLLLRAYAKGKPESVTHTINGTSYVAVKVGDKIYIPDRDKPQDDDAEPEEVQDDEDDYPKGLHQISETKWTDDNGVIYEVTETKKDNIPDSLTKLFGDLIIAR